MAQLVFFFVFFKQTESISGSAERHDLKGKSLNQAVSNITSADLITQCEEIWGL